MPYSEADLRKSTDSPPLALDPAAMARLLGLPGGRKLIAVVGPPGVGKSTIAQALSGALQSAGKSAAVIPMDGFHLDNAILQERGLLSRKGAPASFDAEGFVAMIHRIAQGGEVAYPTFDRDRDIAIAGAAILPAETELVLVEGNYLLLDDTPWRALHALWDLSIRIDASWEAIEKRLLQRWLDQGLTPEQARTRRDANDLPNAKTVRDRSVAADLTLWNN